MESHQMVSREAMDMKLHILSNPHQATGLTHPVEAFSVIIHKFIKNLHNQFDMIHYGLAGSEVHCEHVDLPSHIEAFNKTASQEIGSRKRPGDLVLCFFGLENQPAVAAHGDLKIIEPSIGYHPQSVFAPYRVFASYANMHYYYGHHKQLMEPSWYDGVIPNPFDPDEFQYREDKEDYLLMFGRVTAVKGVHLAIQLAQRTGHLLKIVGPGDDMRETPTFAGIGYSSPPAGVELRGPVGPEERSRLMSQAKAVIAPTHYLEPFGNMVAEAHLCGTPTITTDWGAFSENNPHGVTGYRCRMFEDFVWAVNNIHHIRPADCLRHAVNNFSEAVIYPQYRRYLEGIATGHYYQSRLR